MNMDNYYDTLNIVMHDMLDEYQRILIDDRESATIVASSMYNVLRKTDPNTAKRFMEMVEIVGKRYK